MFKCKCLAVTLLPNESFKMKIKRTALQDAYIDLDNFGTKVAHKRTLAQEYRKYQLIYGQFVNYYGNYKDLKLYRERG